MKNILILLGIALLINSCKRISLPGVYVLNIPNTQDTIYLYSNNTFAQHAIVNSKILSNQGTWKYNDEYIEFDNFIWLIKGYRPINYKKVNWLARQSVSIFGRNQLIVNSDLEYMYIKQ